MKWIRTGLLLGMFVTLSALGGWQTPRPGLTQIAAPHGPTMPPGPDEPIR